MQDEFKHILTIPEFFSNKQLFITGGTGFLGNYSEVSRVSSASCFTWTIRVMLKRGISTGFFAGKVLIDKLLRSCPNIGKIYILVREKKGKKLHERIEQMTQDQVFLVLYLFINTSYWFVLKMFVLVV